MPEESVDRRVKKTKKQLRLALMDLMSEKAKKNISVRELAERADINRGTFYIHYKDVSDLLQRLEDEMAERLSDMCRHHASNTEISSYPFLTDLTDLCWTMLTSAVSCWGPTAILPTASGSAASCTMTSSTIFSPGFTRMTSSGWSISAPSLCPAT